MSIITKPSNIQKGTPASFELDKTELAAISSVAGDSYYSNTLNWKDVLLCYKSNPGNQQCIIKFDASVSNPTTNFLVSNKARNLFEIQQLLIKDFDGGYLRIPRSQLTVAEFDVDFSSVTLENVIFTQPLGIDTYTIVDNSVTKLSGPGTNPGAYHSSIRSQQEFSGDGYIEWANNSSDPLNYFIGLCKNPRGNSISSYEYAINRFPNGYEVYVNGSMRINVSSNAQNVKIEKIGTSVKFYLDSNLIYTESITLDNTTRYFLEASFYYTGNGITNAKIYGDLVDNLPVSLTWTSDASSSNYVTTATSVLKSPTAANAWDLNVVSNETLTGDMYIEATIPPVSGFNKFIMIGFQNTSANSSSQNAVLASINYSTYADTGGGPQFSFIYRDPSSPTGYSSITNLAGVPQGSIVRIELIGGASGIIRLFVNGIVVYTTNVSSITAFGEPYLEPYRVGINIQQPNNGFTDIKFGNL